jgi:hypothetical protein
MFELSRNFELPFFFFNLQPWSAELARRFDFSEGRLTVGAAHHATRKKEREKLGLSGSRSTGSSSCCSLVEDVKCGSAAVHRPRAGPGHE